MLFLEPRLICSPSNRILNQRFRKAAFRKISLPSEHIDSAPPNSHGAPALGRYRYQKEACCPSNPVFADLVTNVETLPVQKLSRILIFMK
jgi:hypothetical protein